MHELDLLLELGSMLDSCRAGLGSLRAPTACGAIEARPVRDLLISALLKIRDKSGRLVALRPNRVQAEYSRQCGPRNIVLKARQLGVTTWIAARFFVHTITRPGTLSVQVAHDQQSAEELFRIVRRFLENLPERLRQGALATSRANVRQIVFPRLDSQYRVESAADPNAGRGLTIHNLHASEVARWPRDAAGTLASLRAAVPPDGETVLESTPSGAGGCFYDEWQHAGENGYVRHFFPWWLEGSYQLELPTAESRQPMASWPTTNDQRPATPYGAPTTDDRRPTSRWSQLEPLSEEEISLVSNHGLTPAQIAFRREMRANFRALAPQEFAEDPESCFLASGECVFDLEAVQRRLAECPPAVEARDNGRLLVWLPAPRKVSRGAPSHQYLIGVDPAGGGALGDYACAQVVQRLTGLQCAELHGHFTPQELARRVADLAREYNHALVAVERNNHGHAVLAHLTRSEQYTNLFEQGGQLGWLTSAATRPQMIENFLAVLGCAPHLFASQRLLQECRTFVRHPDGSSSATAGAHDDCVMAMAIALAVRAADAGKTYRLDTFGLTSLPAM